MSDLPSPTSELETDPRFPSGPWTGFFLQPLIPGRHLMELNMTFARGELTGEGRDWVGKFHLRGKYAVADGRCYWTKSYVGKHDVFYKGYNEGKGIWGVWELESDGLHQSGGFHIWPEGMADPTRPRLYEEADPPLPLSEEIEPGLVPLPVGAARLVSPLRFETFFPPWG